MIVEKILGNLADLSADELADLHLERVEFQGDDLVKRIQRVRTDHDREVGLALTAAPGPAGDLRDGDVLYRDADRIVVVSVAPTDVLVVAPRTIEEMGRVAHSLGNRHLQAQFFGADSDYGAQVMVVRYDHTVEDFLRGVAVPYERADRVMPTPFRHTEHTH